MEHERNVVRLFIHKDIPTFDYIDIATELTRFVHKKPLDTLVHSISDKLVSPLETLKRRGIPVDRLLKTVQQQRKFDRWRIKDKHLPSSDQISITKSSKTIITVSGTMATSLTRSRSGQTH